MFFTLITVYTYFSGVNNLAQRSHAFYVRKNNNIPTVYVNTTIVYENVVLNNGGYYNQNIGQYTAPERGIYVFICNALTLRRFTRVVLMHNNREVSKSYAAAFEYQNLIWNQNASLLAILLLQARDEVHTILVKDHDLNGDGWSHFGGFLLATV